MCVAVTLSGSGGEEFRGFLVQARTVADDSPVGTFIDNGDDQALSSCTPSDVHKCPCDNSLVTIILLAVSDNSSQC